MDRIALEVLRQELLTDADVLDTAVLRARERLEQSHPGALEACGYELNRFYNVLERGFQRICEAFENHLPARGDYHERLIERMMIELPGIRPAFLSRDFAEAVRDVKGFRHVFRNAYDLQLKQERLSGVTRHAELIACDYRIWIAAFIDQVTSQLGDD